MPPLAVERRQRIPFLYAEPRRSLGRDLPPPRRARAKARHGGGGLMYRRRPPRYPLSPIGGEGWGEGADSRALADTHLTLPRLRRGPLPLPPAGRRGQILMPPGRDKRSCRRADPARVMLCCATIGGRKPA